MSSRQAGKSSPEVSRRADRQAGDEQTNKQAGDEQTGTESDVTAAFPRTTLKLVPYKTRLTSLSIIVFFVIVQSIKLHNIRNYTFKHCFCFFLELGGSMRAFDEKFPVTLILISIDGSTTHQPTNPPIYLRGGAVTSGQSESPMFRLN